MADFANLRADLASSGVLTVTLARGRANAVDQAMYAEIARLFEGLHTGQDDVRAVVLAADGPHFCGGNDLAEFATMTPENGAERMWRVRRAFFAIAGCPVPVIGAVHGVALGTGLAIAASCDFVLADRQARFGLPELTVGVMGGARHLARLAPGPLVRRMFFTGEQLTATELHAAGGCVFLCDVADLVAEATRLAERIAGFSPTAVRAGKRVLDRIETMDLQAGYSFEQEATVRMSGHPDSKEALAAFREKRAPRYAPSIDRACFD